MKALHAEHHYKAPLIFSVETQHNEAENYITGLLVIRAPGVTGGLTPVSQMSFEWDGHNMAYHDGEGGFSAHAHTLVKEHLYKSELEHRANRKEIRLAAGLIEIACNPQRCFRLADRLSDINRGTYMSEFDACVATASIALACTDQEYVQHTFEFYAGRATDPRAEAAMTRDEQPGKCTCPASVREAVIRRGARMHSVGCPERLNEAGCADECMCDAGHQPPCRHANCINRSMEETS